MTVPRFLAAGCAVWVAAVAPALAAPVAINNPGFESPTLQDGEFTRQGPPVGTPGEVILNPPIPGWIVPAGANSVGVFNPTIAQGATTEGSNAAFSNFPDQTISQTLSAVLQAGLVYTLRVDVIDRLDTDFPGYAVQLLADGDLLAQASGPVPLANGGSVTAVVAYAALAADPHLGDAIEIRLVSNGIQVDFDNVRLDASERTTVPAPPSVGILAGGVLLAAWRLRMRAAVSNAKP